MDGKRSTLHLLDQVSAKSWKAEATYASKIARCLTGVQPPGGAGPDWIEEKPGGGEEVRRRRPYQLLRARV